MALAHPPPVVSLGFIRQEKARAIFQMFGVYRLGQRTSTASINRVSCGADRRCERGRRIGAGS
jgi:hypothetical protein